MPKKASGLGRDFYSLLDDNAIETKKETAKVSLKDLIPRRDQPRKDFDMGELQVLADSIREHGVLQPILVRENEYESGRYEIVAGERRYRAAGMAGLDEVPVHIMTGDDLEVAKVALIENVQRKDLNPVEEALAYQALIERFGLTQEQVAKQAGKNRSTITNMLRLFDLPDEAVEMVRDGRLSTGHAKALLGLEDKDALIPLAQKAADREWSVRELERVVRQTNEKQDEPEEDQPLDQKAVYMKDLETRLTGSMGRKVRIHQTPRKKTIEFTFEDDQDLEDLIKRIAGQEFFN